MGEKEPAIPRSTPLHDLFAKAAKAVAYLRGLFSGHTFQRCFEKLRLV
jgi:hypothetical protein